MELLNKQGVAEHAYFVQFYDSRGIMFARTERQARQRAIEHFKPRKNQMDKLQVGLHSLNHETTFVVAEEVGEA